MYGLFGKFRTQAGQRETMIQYLIEGSQGMEGCYIYIVSRDNDDPEGIWVTEIWRSKADHQASLQLESVQAVIAKARPLIAEMPLRYEFTPVGGHGLPDNIEE